MERNDRKIRRDTTSHFFSNFALIGFAETRSHASLVSWARHIILTMPLSTQEYLKYLLTCCLFSSLMTDLHGYSLRTLPGIHSG